MTAPSPRPADGKPLVSVVVVSYRTPDLLVACLRSLLSTTADMSVEVVVVDNASGDATVGMLRSEFAGCGIDLVESPENLGFARAVNLGASRSNGDWVLLLNPDTVVHPGAIQALLGFALRHPEGGLYGGRTLTPDGSLDPSSCWGAPSLWSLTCFATGLSTFAKGNRFLDPESLGSWKRDSAREVGVVTGCLLLVPRALWDSLGGLDERFFMYGEDADLAMRARAAGKQPMITPDAVITHASGASSATRADKMSLVMQGKATLALTHWTGWRQAYARAALVAGVGLRAGLDRASSAVGRGSESDRPWVGVWRARSDWASGYEAAPAPAPRPLTRP